jgi:dihydropteroate synthase
MPAAIVEEGADILDIGGESSRPGAQSVSIDEELRRVLPVFEALAGDGMPLSVDTLKPEVMRRAVAAGASIINDIAALQAPGALEAAAASDAAVCLMHMQGEPGTMQADPQYDDVVAEVRDFLARRVATAQAAGIATERIIVDPGFGFGKRLEHNLALLRELAQPRRAGGLRAGGPLAQVHARRDHREKSRSARDGERGGGAPCRAEWG